jgi:tetratricopeptide (TPR) repeat protein
MPEIAAAAPRPAGRAFVAATIVGAALGYSPIAPGHGDLHEHIARVEQQIAASPADAGLYLRRAELHRQHQDWERAERDYHRALELVPDHAEAPWMRARAQVESGKAALALAALDRFLERHPEHPSARLTRARAAMALGRFGTAVEDYALALDRLPAVEPDLFLERRDAQQRAGIPLHAQLAGIELALQRLGPVPSLEDAALELELRTGAFEAALARLDRQAEASARKDRWHYRRGLALAQAGRLAQAADAFRAALVEIDKLPPHLRATRASMTLLEQLHGELAKLEQVGGDARPASR